MLCLILNLPHRGLGSALGMACPDQHLNKATKIENETTHKTINRENEQHYLIQLDAPHCQPHTTSYNACFYLLLTSHDHYYYYYVILFFLFIYCHFYF